jgi:hypothetical protein
MARSESKQAMIRELGAVPNATAKRDLAWRPTHPSWRQGFAAA